MPQQMQPDVHVVQSFVNLSGTSSSFTLPVGYYLVEMRGSDPNNPPSITVQTIDGIISLATLNTIVGGGNTDFGIAQIPGVGGQVAFQVGPGMTLNLVVVGLATSVMIYG